MPSRPIVGAFVFPDFWENPFRANSNLTHLRDCGVNAIMTESDRYDLSALDATHKARLRFFAGVACFSDHASNFRLLNQRPELWPVLENGERRPQMEWYVGMSPTDSRRREEALAEVSRLRGRTPWTGSFLISRVGRCTGKSSSGLSKTGRSIQVSIRRRSRCLRRRQERFLEISIRHPREPLGSTEIGWLSGSHSNARS